MTSSFSWKENPAFASSLYKKPRQLSLPNAIRNATQQKMEKNATLTGILKKAAADFPSRRALSVSGKFDLTHARLQQLVDEGAASIVAAGVRTGDVVALTFPNTVEVRFNPQIPPSFSDIQSNLGGGRLFRSKDPFLLPRMAT
ncbi:hypothetical protein ACLOJK_015579 [Asimina triloba]